MKVRSKPPGRWWWKWGWIFSTPAKEARWSVAELARMSDEEADATLLACKAAMRRDRGYWRAIGIFVGSAAASAEVGELLEQFLRASWLGTLIWPLCFGVGMCAGGVVSNVIERAVLRKYIRRELGQTCRVCDYNLTGNVSGVCPECGTPIAPRNATGT